MAVIKTRTDYTLDQMEELQRVAGKTFARRQTLRKRSFALSWGVLCMGIGLSLAFRKNSVVITLICCALGAMLLAYGFLFYQLTAWTSYRAMGKNRDGNEFYFEKSEILAVRDKDSSRFPYTACLQLMETERNIYFIMDGGQGIILDKTKVRGGSVEELRDLLTKRCGKTLDWVGKKSAKPEETSVKP